VRGFARHSSDKIGNFWVDLVRSTVYVFLPLSIVGALLLVFQGVIRRIVGQYRSSQKAVKNGKKSRPQSNPVQYFL
jgi:K+-transporting ATPase A subunit